MNIYKLLFPLYALLIGWLSFHAADRQLAETMTYTVTIDDVYILRVPERPRPEYWVEVIRNNERYAARISPAYYQGLQPNMYLMMIERNGRFTGKNYTRALLDVQTSYPVVNCTPNCHR